MLSQLERLSREVDGRYANDVELAFAIDYVRSFNLRSQTYQKLQELESTIVQQAYIKMRSIDPTLFVGNRREDLTHKCISDMAQVLRATAKAVLLNDPDNLQEETLRWLQTIMRAVGRERACGMACEVLQEILQQHLTQPQADLVCPILALNRRMLGTSV